MCKEQRQTGRHYFDGDISKTEAYLVLTARLLERRIYNYKILETF
jgi:hypothetical protein